MTELSNFYYKAVPTSSVLVIEADGYDSEVFVPQIVDGKIVLINVIEKRRCCAAMKRLNMANKVNCGKRVGGNSSHDHEHKNGATDENRRLNINKNLEFGRGFENLINNSVPLANSTPSVVRYSSVKSDGSTSLGNTNNTTSVGAARRAILTQSIEAVNINIEESPDRAKKEGFGGTKLIKKIGQTEIFSLKGKSNAQNVKKRLPGSRNISTYESLNTSEFKLPASPSTSINTSFDALQQREGPQISLEHRVNDRQRIFKDASTTAASIYQKVCGISVPESTLVSDKTSNFTVSNLASPSPKWRNVLTPKRIYGSRIYSPANVKNKKIIPTYLHNPTQAPKPDKKIVVQKHKTIVDTKTAISPKTFRRQLKEHSNLKSPNRFLDSKFVRTIEGYNHFKNSAFDLLTNLTAPSNSVCKDLRDQFRMACLNTANRIKATSSQRILENQLPPIKEDAEVRQFRKFKAYSKSLAAKRKRRYHNDDDEILGNLLNQKNYDDNEDDDAESGSHKNGESNLQCNTKKTGSLPLSDDFCNNGDLQQVENSDNHSETPDEDAAMEALIEENYEVVRDLLENHPGITRSSLNLEAPHPYVDSQANPNATSSENGDILNIADVPDDCIVVFSESDNMTNGDILQQEFSSVTGFNQKPF